MLQILHVDAVQVFCFLEYRSYPKRQIVLRLQCRGSVNCSLRGSNYLVSYFWQVSIMKVELNSLYFHAWP